ncbi:MAG: nucleotide exchange factor GrpE [Bacteroidales bacterium]
MGKSKKQAKNNKVKEEKVTKEQLENQEQEILNEEKNKEKVKETEGEADPIQDLENKNKEISDKYLRLYSEFDNFRKRTLKEKADLSKYASEKIVKAILPVIDDFERALKSVEENSTEKEGITLIFNKLGGILDKEGLKPIESIGKDFDTDFHEAITQIPAPEKKQKGKVIDEIEKGYELNGKVIRFAKVVVGC